MADNTGNMTAPTQLQTACDQLNSTVGHSPFARPGSRAGASTAPATLTGTPSASISPFAHQAAALDQHNRKLISLEQPHKLRDHRAVTH